jgi:hypothetical protein
MDYTTKRLYQLFLIEKAKYWHKDHRTLYADFNDGVGSRQWSMPFMEVSVDSFGFFVLKHCMRQNNE